MVDNEDSYVAKLLQEIGSLWGSNSASNPTTYAPAESHKALINDTDYMAPIHGVWHNSGGFDLSMRRANGRVGHQGVDLRAPGGTPIYSFGPGVVSGVGQDPLGGNVINIQHPNGTRTYYAHLGGVKVHKGQQVNAQTIIGTVGNSGNASHTFPHLHFQIWQNGQITNPANFFSVPKYSDLLPEEKSQGMWLSDQAKQQAQSFNMKDYLSKSNRQASANNDLVKLSEYFEYVAKQQLTNIK